MRVEVEQQPESRLECTLHRLIMSLTDRHSQTEYALCTEPARYVTQPPRSNSQMGRSCCGHLGNESTFG